MLGTGGRPDLRGATLEGSPRLLRSDVLPGTNLELRISDLVDQFLGHALELGGINRAVVVESERELFLFIFYRLHRLLYRMAHVNDLFLRRRRGLYGPGGCRLISRSFALRVAGEIPGAPRRTRLELIVGRETIDGGLNILDQTGFYNVRGFGSSHLSSFPIGKFTVRQPTLIVWA